MTPPDPFAPFRDALAHAAAGAPPHLLARVRASDLVQETCLRAAAHLGQFHGSTSAELFAWLRAILTRVIAEQRRHFAAACRHAPGQVSLTPEGHNAPQIADPGPSPSGLAAAGEAAAAVRHQIARLPDHLRHVLLRRTVDDLSFAAIAAELGLPETTVRRRFAEAVGLLQRPLEGHR